MAINLQSNSLLLEMKLGGDQDPTLLRSWCGPTQVGCTTLPETHFGVIFLLAFAAVQHSLFTAKCR